MARFAKRNFILLIKAEAEIVNFCESLQVHRAHSGNSMQPSPRGNGNQAINCITCTEQQQQQQYRKYNRSNNATQEQKQKCNSSSRNRSATAAAEI